MTIGMTNGRFRLFNGALKITATALALFLCLFGDSQISGINGVVGSILRRLTDTFRDPETQWMVFLCVAVNLLIFLLLQYRISELSFWRATNPSLWLTGMLFLGTLVYAFNYSAAAQSTQALMLLAGAALGSGVALWADFGIRNQKSETRNETEPRSGSSLGVFIVPLLVILLTLASLWRHPYWGSPFEYRGHARWTGPWDNPNAFGLLMGVGIVVTIGMAVSSFRFQVFSESIAGSWKSGVKRYAVIIVCLFVAILMGRALLHSYSRGAWLAAICGLAYLVNRVFSFQFSVFSQWLRRGAPFLVIIVLSLCASAFWQFQHTEHEYVVIRRAFSAGNVNDFSWRNRVAAWEGALQIMAEHPVLGAGWNQPESLHDHYYSSLKVDEVANIQLNDYLMLGATLGVPALICFGCISGFPYIRNQMSLTLDFGLWTLDWSQTICRAGAIVLLVGFWFDGGLFELPTAATFWILLELGSAESAQLKALVPYKNCHKRIHTCGLRLEVIIP